MKEDKIRVCLDGKVIGFVAGSFITPKEIEDDLLFKEGVFDDFKKNIIVEHEDVDIPNVIINRETLRQIGFLN